MFLSLPNSRKKINKNISLGEDLEKKGEKRQRLVGEEESRGRAQAEELEKPRGWKPGTGWPTLQGHHGQCSRRAGPGLA